MVHPGLEGPAAVPGQHVRGERHDARRRAPAFGLLAADRGRRRVAVHAGHLAIHQDRVEPARVRLVHRGTAVLDERHAATNALQHGERDLAVDGVVVRDEHVETECRQSGWVFRLAHGQPRSHGRRLRLPRLA